MLYAFRQFPCHPGAPAPDVYTPEGAEGAYAGRRAAALGGYPLIMRAMLNDDERVWLYMGAFDPPIFRR